MMKSTTWESMISWDYRIVTGSRVSPVFNIHNSSQTSLNIRIIWRALKNFPWVPAQTYYIKVSAGGA